MANTLKAIVIYLGLLNLAIGTSQPGIDISKGHLKNVTLNSLTSGYLNHIYPDVLSLKITHSKIDKIDKYAFDYLNHLNLLEISNSKIQEQIDSETFTRLPSLEILVLRNLGLKNVNLNLTNVQKLILTGNDIEVVIGDLIKGRNVNYLDLSGNKLRTLQGSFANMSKLSVVDISENDISVVPQVFNENINLINICAAQNKITTTEGVRLPWLKKLDLFANRIPILDSKSFKEMRSLEELILAMNKIHKIDDAFKDLIELKHLNLAWNEIEELHPELFRNNLYLTKLFIQGNKIRFLGKFETVLYHLTHIDISHNELTLIQDEFFQSTPRLEVLDVSFNHLKTITDSMKTLGELKVVNFAFNEILMNGDELSGNKQLIRANLSFNALEGGLTHFKNNHQLRELDLSHNNIFNICDGQLELNNLLKLNLKQNLIKNLDCLRNLTSLCEIDLRMNPLPCGGELNDLIKSFALRKSSPYNLVPEFQSDLLPNQCENLSLNRSFDLWNSIKRELCPKDGDLQMEIKMTTREWASTEKEDVIESVETHSIESSETKENLIIHKGPIILKKIQPIAWITHDEMNKPNPLQSPQSEKFSWESIEKKNPELLNGFEDEELGKRPRFTWYTIALILIGAYCANIVPTNPYNINEENKPIVVPIFTGLSFTLTCFNLLVFFYIKMKARRRSDSNSSQKYTVLQHNEVYRNTTEPSKVYQVAERDWMIDNQTKNKIFTYGKINEFLFNFGPNKKDQDSESAKNILINSATNNQQNC